MKSSWQRLKGFLRSEIPGPEPGFPHEIPCWNEEVGYPVLAPRRRGIIHSTYWSGVVRRTVVTFQRVARSSDRASGIGQN